MEKIQISKEQEKKLLSLFKSRASLWIVFFIIGLSGLIPIGITFFGDSDTSFYSSSTFVFFMFGIAFWIQSEGAKKKITKGDYQVYKAECKKVGWEYASVENNGILSKNVNNPIKKIQILGSTKSIQAGEEIGILQTSKEFWAFPLNE
jgi:hypothetical protein